MEQFRLFAFHIGVSRLARGQKNAITRCCKVRAGLSDRRWKSSNTITLSLLRPPCLQRNTVTALSTHPRSTLAASVTWARRAGTAMATGTGRHSLLWLHEREELCMATGTGRHPLLWLHKREEHGHRNRPTLASSVT